MALTVRNSASGTSSSDGLSITVENPTADVAIRQRENANMKFLTNNAERMRITDGGDVSIGSDHGGFSGWRVLNLRGESGSGALINWEANNATRKAAIAQSGSDLRLQVFDTGSITFEPGTGTERMRISSNGSIGVGTTDSTYTMSLQNIVSNDVLLQIKNTTANEDTGIFIDAVQGGAATNSRIGHSVIAGNNLLQITNPNGHAFYTGTSSIAERMRIDSSGRVGIAQDTPGDFNSGANALVIGNSSGSTGITIRTGTSNTGSIFFADGTSGSQTYMGAIQYNHSLEAMIFGTNGGTERMRVDSTGRLAVGGTATSGSTAGVTVSSASSGYRHMYIWNSGMYFWNGANEANLSSGGAWNNASDERLKENITDIPYGLAEVKQLQPKKYSMITGGEGQVGLIAQEVETIIPELVTTSGEANMKSLSYGNLNAVLIKAIQEQQTIIESLTARITTLEG